MTFDFTLYPPGAETALAFTVEAVSEVEARVELRERLRGLGVGEDELQDYRVAVTVVSKWPR